MLIALLIAYFAGSSGGGLTSQLLGDPAKLRDAIRHHVKDPARLARLEALVAEVKSADKEARATLAGTVETVGKVAARQASTTAELEAAVASLMDGRRAERERDLALRLRLASLTTAQEWVAIVAEVFPFSTPGKAPRGATSAPVHGSAAGEADHQ
jgi:hypothetical protein